MFYSYLLSTNHECKFQGVQLLKLVLTVAVEFSQQGEADLCKGGVAASKGNPWLSDSWFVSISKFKLGKCECVDL